jgi:hypothetical protein
VTSERAPLRAELIIVSRFFLANERLPSLNNRQNLKNVVILIRKKILFLKKIYDFEKLPEVQVWCRLNIFIVLKGIGFRPSTPTSCPETKRTGNRRTCVSRCIRTARFTLKTELCQPNIPTPHETIYNAARD